MLEDLMGYFIDIYGKQITHSVDQMYILLIHMDSQNII